MHVRLHQVPTQPTQERLAGLKGSFCQRRPRAWGKRQGEEPGPERAIRGHRQLKTIYGVVSYRGRRSEAVLGSAPQGPSGSKAPFRYRWGAALSYWRALTLILFLHADGPVGDSLSV